MTEITGGNLSKTFVVVQNTQPSSPFEGQIWVDTTSNSETKQYKNGSWETITSELGRFVSLSEYRSLQNRWASLIAENQFEVGLQTLNYPDGFYDIFRDESKIEIKNQINVQTLEGGDANGIIELDRNIQNNWMLSSASYSTTSLNTQDAFPSGIFWKSDGTKFWEIGENSDLIYEYDVSTAWDLSTASYSGTSLSTQDASPQGIFWKGDGTKFWEIGSSTDSIYEYDVGTAWDLSTATYSGTSLAAQDGNPEGIFWKGDGSKFWEIGYSSDLIYEWNVSTAWDLSTASYSGTSLSTQDGSPTGIFWKPDGTKFWEIGRGSDLIYEYNVSTAWDLSTASYSGTSISTQDGSPTGIFWKSDGTKFWEIGYGSDSIYEHDVGSNQGLFSSGSLQSTTQEKGYQASKATVTADYSLNGQNIDSIELFDGSDNLLASWNESEIGTTKPVSTSRTDYYAEINLSGDGTDTPIVNKYEIGLDN